MIKKHKPAGQQFKKLLQNTHWTATFGHSTDNFMVPEILVKSVQIGLP